MLLVLNLVSVVILSPCFTHSMVTAYIVGWFLLSICHICEYDIIDNAIIVLWSNDGHVITKSIDYLFIIEIIECMMMYDVTL